MAAAAVESGGMTWRLGAYRARAAQINLRLPAAARISPVFFGRRFDDPEHGGFYGPMRHGDVHTLAAAMAKGTDLKRSQSNTAVGIDKGAVAFHVSLHRLTVVTGVAGRRSGCDNEVGVVGHTYSGRLEQRL